ncbi:MAG TPA: alpha-2-macroglobulin [Stellaceae bacterium]|nr:alpha-2-macroglobulin [Stellaceae bacterium]
MRRMIWVAAAVAVAGLGVIAFLTLDRGTPPPQPATTAAMAPGAPAPTSASPAAPASATPASATPAAAPQQPAKPTVSLPPTLNYVYSDVDTTKAQAQTCLIFDEPLDATGQTDYGAYVALDPAAKVTFRVDQRRLCITGLAFGQHYKATVKAGLPAASGHKLANEQSVELTLTDRPPLVAFRDGLILPRESLAGVPITTVNVDQVHVTVYRVPDRLVSQIRRDQIAEHSMNTYEINQIGSDQSAQVWEGDLTITSEKNATATTLFPLAQAIVQRKPGLYLLTAESVADRKSRLARHEDYYYDQPPLAVQWVIDTDIGLTTFAGADGLNVFARSLGAALPVAGLTVTLVARDNDELAKVETDAEGHAKFDPGLLRGQGGAIPAAVMAYSKDGDFTVEDMTRPAFDLSDRGVEGRALPGPVDAYLYSDRGIYRPRETVHVVALLRDRLADAIPATPVTLVIRRPDGVEYRRVTLSDETMGAVHYDLTLTETAAHGRWQVDAYLDPKGVAVGHREFDVQDFIPQRLKVELDAKSTTLDLSQPIPVGVAVRFLYGAPGAGLSGEADATIDSASAPFPHYDDWYFGLSEETFKEQVVQLQVADTDDQGMTKIDGQLDQVADSSLPLQATLRVAIYEPGGRSTETRLTLPIKTKPLWIGIRPRFRDERIQEDTEAAFDVMALDSDGNKVAREGLRYSLVRERSEYHWLRGDNGRYHFERTTYDVPISEGTLDVKAETPAEFKQALPWGEYRFTVSDQQSGAASSMSFYSGWAETVAEDRPDKGEVSADKKTYQLGDTARLTLRPPADGEGLLVIGSDRVIMTRELHVPAEGTTVEVPVTADWGTGVYAIFSSYKPLKSADKRAPVRAIGVAWLPVDPAARTLGVELGVPDKVLPRRTVQIPVTVSNTTQGERTFLTLAAVDEGILQLTSFKSPDPGRYYFGKRRLAIDIRDDYGRLISGEGPVGAIRQGGDSIGGAALAVVPTKTVALFSGFVTVDAQGHATVPLDIPDFEGELRLMAVAFDRHKVGAAEGHLTVRDPVVSDVVLPRFLAPDDHSRLSLSLHNLDGKPGDYHAAFSVDGAVEMPGEHERTVTLGSGERQLLAFDVAARDIGIGTFSLHLTGPDGFAVDRQWQIAVRSAQDPIARTSLLTIGTGKDASFSADLLQGYIPGSASVSISLATWRSLPIAAVLRSLDRYPYGCIEQTTSRAFPLLYFNDVALATHDAADADLKGRVQGAIDRVLDMQRSAGNFGFWSSGSFPAYDWLSVYALDFLFSARAQGYNVSDDALERGQSWLKQVVRGERTEEVADHLRGNIGSTRDYAAYVLARNGGAALADLRYLYDTTALWQLRAFPQGQLAAALALQGDVSRSGVAFGRVERLALGPVRGPFRVFYDDDYYGSTLRDWAGLVRVAAEAKQTALVNRLFQRLDAMNGLPDDLTTQEKAWLMLAEHALAEHRTPVKATVNGQAVQGTGDPMTLSPDAAALAKGYRLANAGDRELYATVSVEGVPSEPLPPESKGATMERTFFTLDGKPADIAHLKQNDRIIVSISGRISDNRHHEMVLRDLLPAGLEIEAAIPATDDNSNNTSPYAFLPKQRFTHLTEARDDRFVTSFVVLGEGDYYYWITDDRDDDNTFAFAYIARAVTPGSYVLPAAYIEDMYRPGVRARTAMGSLSISAR